MNAARVLFLVFLVSLSATSVVALPQWMVTLLGLCDDGDNGPTDPEKPLPFISIHSYARDPEGTQWDECVDEKGEKKPISEIVNERFCPNKKIESKTYNCLEHGFVACVDQPGRGAACVRALPPTTPKKCGNDIVDPGEECDGKGKGCATKTGAPGTCNDKCKCVPLPKPPKKCGNAKLDAGEECDPPGGKCGMGFAGKCNAKCQCEICGNKRRDPGEQCDPPGSPAPGCPPIRLPWGGCGHPECLAGCKCPVGQPCPPGGLPPVQPPVGAPVRTPSCGDKIVDKPYEECETNAHCGAGKVCQRCKCVPMTVETEIVPLQPVGQPPVQPTPKTCDELCRERGLVTQQPDWTQAILTALRQDRCAASHRTTGAGKTTLQSATQTCVCYSTQPPAVTHSPERGVCQNSPCGRPIECGKSDQCPCPGQENCILTVNCGPGDWDVKDSQIFQVRLPQAAVQQQFIQTQQPTAGMGDFTSMH